MAPTLLTIEALQGMAVLRFRVLIVCLLLFLSGCGSHPPSEKTLADHGRTPESVARQIVNAVSERNMEQLVGFIHPRSGVQFSPYGHFSSESDVTIRAEDLIGEWAGKRTRSWGFYDGSGDEIALDIQAYFDAFVYDRDYVHAPTVLINREARTGATRGNTASYFPNSTFVEFHFPGSEKYAGSDWSSLRIVLQPNQEGGWWLRGISHGQWTI